MLSDLFINSRRIFYILFYCLISLSFGYKNSWAISDCILAHFNNQIITKGDLNERLKLIAFFNNTSVENISQNDELKESILRSLIDEKILLEKARSLNIKPKDEEIQISINNFFLNSGVKLEQFGGLNKFLKGSGLSYEAFENFILNEIVVSKIIEYFKEEINKNKEAEKIFKNLNKFQIKSEYSEYEIVEFSFAKQDDIQEKIKSLEKSNNCENLRQNLLEIKIPFKEYEIKVSDMNSELLGQIKSQGDKKIGFISFKKNNENENGEIVEEINFLSFCPRGDEKISKIPLNEMQLENLIQRNQIKKIINEVIYVGKKENLIVFNKDCCK